MKVKLQNFRHELFKGCFNVGFIINKPFDKISDLPFKSIHWLDLNGYDNGWFADPFILDYNSSVITVLVEEFEYSNEKGRLCKIIVSSKDYKLLKVVPLLELETHLSYPSIYRFNDKIFICPENSAAGYVRAYQLKDDSLLNPTLLIQDSLVDTQFVQIDNKFYAFGVKNYVGAMDETKTLNIYESSNFLGPYKHIQTIINDKCEERGAGNFFNFEGKLYRPAQCCEGWYGKGIIFYEVTLRDERFSEKEIFRISGDYYKKWGLGMHQFHSYKDLTVVDGQDFCHLFARIFKRFQLMSIK